VICNDFFTLAADMLTAMKNISRMAISLLFMTLWSLLPTSVAAQDSFVSLIYHRFGEDNIPSTNIRLEQFRAHLDHLQEGGFEVISLQQAYDFLENGTQLPNKAVLITVDDAYLSVYREAYPLLQEYNFPFTVFVATDPVDQKLNGYMSWDQMREMQANGVSFANHSATHESLLRRFEGERKNEWLERVEADIDKSMARLNEELDPFPGAFAYPYGEFNVQTGNLLRQKGYISFGQQSGAIGSLSDQRWLPRFPMNENFGEIDDFRTKVSSLPLPIISVQPEDHFTNDRRPEVEIELAGASERIGELACYVSGQGQVPIEWKVTGRSFRVGPVENLPTGRSRVNCTAPTNSGRFLWFSHHWVIGASEHGERP
jgi:poly-beta-1,6-N-acetyl-D-glucosamine N-deacetylase